MVRIVKGIYGYKNTDGVIEPKTCKDEPFSLTEEQEERLVSKGVAEYVEVAPVQPQEDANKNEKKAEGPGQEMIKGHLEREQLMGMGYNDLKKLAKEMGIPATGSKDELVGKIAEEEIEYHAEYDEEEDGVGDEEPPVLNPEEPQ